MERNEPLVSVGMPVLNGERYLEEAIRSVLEQTLQDLELILCDNASTDCTETISRKFLENDRRVRYYRNEQNIGAHPNYNKAFSLSTGRYFKWASHDDLLRPTFLERCVQSLETDSTAVLCQSYLGYIDAQGHSIGTYDSQLLDANASSPSSRFAAVILRPHPALDVFGVFRRAILKGSILLKSFHGADRALLAELSLRGRFLQVREPLQMVRDHSDRYTRAQVRPRERAHWHDSRLTSRFVFPTWRLYLEYLKMVGRNVESRPERLQCYRQLVKWWGRNWNAARMGVDVLAVFVPQSLRGAERLKQSLFTPAPGSDEITQKRSGPVE